MSRRSLFCLWLMASKTLDAKTVQQTREELHCRHKRIESRKCRRSQWIAELIRSRSHCKAANVEIAFSSHCFQLQILADLLCYYINISELQNEKCGENFINYCAWIEGDLEGEIVACVKIYPDVWLDRRREPPARHSRRQFWRLQCTSNSSK